MSQDRPNFDAWSSDELVDWAYGTHDLVVEQQEKIMALQQRVKDLEAKLKGATDDWK